MKIAIPTSGKKGLDDKIYFHFGRAPSYTIFDTKIKEVKIIKNTSSHFDNKKLPPELLAENNVGVLLCMDIGIRALNLCKKLGIEVYQEKGKEKVKEIIRNYQEGRLDKVNKKDIF